ncbi:MAG TPA: hypothetical protein HPQ04_08715 [Rhodospirillaceae bacterium]|nr:hypothetical protein [Rhodospirillaceae bacterium]
MSPSPAALAMMLLLAAAPVAADDLDLHGFLDLRLVAPPGQTAWPQGGLGKTRFGGFGLAPRFGAAGLDGSLQLTSDLLLVADLVVRSTDRLSIDPLEAYLRYRPVSTSPLRWSVRSGIFYPPVSLENTALGWTSPWTITPSAINSWVGEELLSLGSELRFEWRGQPDQFELAAALFENADPAGAILAARGWSLSDLPIGLGSSLRQPDAFARAVGETPPLRYDPFQEIDHTPGWYGEATWKSTAAGRLTLVRYDNNADPSAAKHYGVDDALFAWRTAFWSAAGETRLGDVTLLGQAMAGDTIIAPAPRFRSTTSFQAAYLLAGWSTGAWRPAVRLDLFTTQQAPRSRPFARSEHGKALTAALNWRPVDWCRLTGEVMLVDSWRLQRLATGDSPQASGVQTQLSLRFFY